MLDEEPTPATSETSPALPQHRFRLRIGHRVVSVLGVALVTSLVLLSVGALFFVRRAEAESWRGRQTEAAQHAAQEVSDFVQQTQTSLALMGALSARTVQEDPALVETLLGDMPFMLEVVFVDKDGRTYASAARDEQLLDNLFTVRQSNWFHAASRGQTYVGDVQISPGGEPYIIEAAPAANGGAIGARLRLELLRGVVQDLTFGRSGSAYVINRSGKVVAHTDPRLAEEYHRIPEGSILAAASEGRSLWTDEYVTPDGETRVAATAPVAGTEWAVVAELPQSEAYSSSRQAVPFLLLFAAGAGLILLAWGARSLSRVVIRPLEQLRTGAELVGRGDFGHRIEIANHDELGEVAHAFNEMSERLRERNTQLAEQTELLHEEILERERAQDELRHQALHDALTGLPNRILFTDRLEQTIARQHRTGGLSAILFLDIDGFKLINDSLGHSVGDELLIGIGQRFLDVVRPEDTVARLGGDEFVVLAEGLTDSLGVERVAERLQGSLSSPFEIWNHEVYVTASIGVCVVDEGTGSAEDLLRNADIAMYRAKSEGKADFAVFEESMLEGTVERLDLERDMRRALDSDEFILHYQPIISLTEGRVVGCEALVRWEHPTRGLVPPGEFIPLAEETGMIIGIGDRVLRMACLQSRRWSDMGHDITVSVNLSRRHFTQAALMERVSDVLTSTGVEPRQLILEITESFVIHDAAVAASVLFELKALGVGIHMDDFGTGYSSLASLHSFPIDAVKIDRSFVARMGEDALSAGLVGTILTLAEDMGIEAIVEGVETRGQLRLLSELGCRFVQGFFLARPMPAEALDDILTGAEWRDRFEEATRARSDDEREVMGY